MVVRAAGDQLAELGSFPLGNLQEQGLVASDVLLLLELLAEFSPKVDEEFWATIEKVERK